MHFTGQERSNQRTSRPFESKSGQRVVAKAIMPKRKALVRRPSGSSTDQFKEIQNYLRSVAGLFSESGILKHIKPQDVILADIGFNVQDPLNPLQAKIKIPAFLQG